MALATPTTTPRKIKLPLRSISRRRLLCCCCVAPLETRFYLHKLFLSPLETRFYLHKLFLAPLETRFYLHKQFLAISETDSIYTNFFSHPSRPHSIYTNFFSLSLGPSIHDLNQIDFVHYYHAIKQSSIQSQTPGKAYPAARLSIL